MADDEQWFWCTRHGRAELGRQCPATYLMGPYDTKQDAESYAERAAARNERWKDEDKRWEEGSADERWRRWG